MAAVFCCAAVILSLSALAENDLKAERHFAAPTCYDTCITLPTGQTFAYYAQNDTLWGDMIYESKSSTKLRPLRDGGCAPTAVAMAVRCVVPDEMLLLFNEHCKIPYSICECSVNKWHCERNHPRYYITSVKDYKKFLPLVIADFACGNNDAGVSARTENKGTGMGFVDALARMFNLSIVKTDSTDEALAYADMGYGVVAYAASGGAFTSTGHYILLAGGSGENLFFLDPLCRASYKATDSYGVITPLYQGLVSVQRNDLGRAMIYSYTVFMPK